MKMSNGRSLYGRDVKSRAEDLSRAFSDSTGDPGEFGGMHGLILNEVFAGDFSGKTMNENYGEVSLVSGRIVDEPGFLFLAVRNSLVEAMDSWLFGECGNAAASGDDFPLSVNDVSSRVFTAADEERKTYEEFYTERNLFDAGGFTMQALGRDDGKLSEEFAEPNPLREFDLGLFGAESSYERDSSVGTDSPCVFTDTEERTGAQTGVPSEAGSDEDAQGNGMLNSRDVFDMFDFAEKADYLLKRHDRDNRMLWIESNPADGSDLREKSGGKILRYGVLRETVSRLMKNGGAHVPFLGAPYGMKRTGLGPDELSLITDCMRADGLSDAVYRGLRFLAEEGGSGNRRDPFFPIKLDALISDNVSDTDVMDEDSLSVGDCSRRAEIASELLLRGLYRRVFSAEVIPPKYLHNGEEAEFINRYVTDLVLARIMFASVNAAEKRNMNLQEYLKAHDAKVSVVEAGSDGKKSGRLNSRGTPESVGATGDNGSSGEPSREFKELIHPEITDGTGFLRLNAVCPENLLRLKLFDGLVDAEIAGHKYDGAFFEMIENLADRNFPILWGIKLLLNSQKGDLKNKARCLKTNLGFFFDVRKFAAVTRIRMPDINLESGVRRITNKKTMTVRQKHRFRQLVDVSLYVAAMVLSVFSETEILFNGRTTLKHLGRAAANMDVVKRNVGKGLRKYGGRGELDEEISDVENACSEDRADDHECDSFIRNKTYSVKFRVLDLKELNHGVKGLALRIISAPRIELMYLAVLTILTIVEPEEEYMDILGREFDRSIPEITSGKKVLLLQWRFNEKKK